MAKYFLLNPVLVAGGRLLWPGQLIDSVQEDVGVISAKGGRLYAATNATVAAGAAEAQSIKLRGGKLEQAEAVMSTAAQVADLAGVGGGTFKVSENFDLVGYSTSTQVAQLSPVYSPGVIDDSVEIAAYDVHWLRMIPAVVVGDNQAGVIDGSGHTTSGPAVDVTVYGMGVAGVEVSCVFHTNGAGVYLAAAPRAMKVPLLRVTTSASLTRSLGIYSAKGFGTSAPFEDATFEMGVISYVVGQDVPSYLHGASGTVIPSGEWNVGEGRAYVRYRPLAG